MIQIPGSPPAEHVLLVDSFTIGRAPNNTIVLDTPSVAPLHVEITRRAEGFVLSDPGSTTGTKLNGQPVTRAELQDGDVLRLGDVSAVFWSQPSALAGGAPHLPPKPLALPDGSRSKSDTSVISAKAKTARLRPLTAKAATPFQPAQEPARTSGAPRAIVIIAAIVLVAALGVVGWKLMTQKPGQVSAQLEPLPVTESNAIPVAETVAPAQPVETNAAPSPELVPPPTPVVPPLTSAPAPAIVVEPAPIPASVPTPRPEPASAALTSAPAPAEPPPVTNVVAVSNLVAAPAAEKPPAQTNAPVVVSPEQVPELLRDLRAPDVAKRREAAKLLSSVRDASADALVNLRVSLLQNEDREVRFWLAVALANNDVRDAANVNALLEGLRFEDAATRRMTCETLARFRLDKAGQRPVFIGLRSAAEDADESVRKAAIAALKVLALEEAASR